jgi:uncharacterized protein (DUF1697 family)
MTTYVALLRAVNVGGTGKLSMADLKAMCMDIGFDGVETYIASGNVVFDSSEPSGKVEARLEKRLLAHAGKAIGVIVRTAEEMKIVHEANPFADQPPNLTHAFFLPERPAADALHDLRGRAGEEIRLGTREIYVYYPSGMGQSKLRIPAARYGTARNLNTVAKLVAMSSRDRAGGGRVRSNQR